MNFEFSFVGLLFLIMLFVPNILWSRFPPKDYEKFSENENKILLALERIGQILVSALSLFCGVKFSFDMTLIIAFILMIFYEMYWVRYFRSPKTMDDMYENFLGIPLPGATLPVVSFFAFGYLCRKHIFGNVFYYFGNWPYRNTFGTLSGDEVIL